MSEIREASSPRQSDTNRPAARLRQAQGQRLGTKGSFLNLLLQRQLHAIKARGNSREQRRFAIATSATSEGRGGPLVEEFSDPGVWHRGPDVQVSESSIPSFLPSPVGVGTGPLGGLSICSTAIVHSLGGGHPPVRGSQSRDWAPRFFGVHPSPKQRRRAARAPNSRMRVSGGVGPFRAGPGILVRR